MDQMKQTDEFKQDDTAKPRPGELGHRCPLHDLLLPSLMHQDGPNIRRLPPLWFEKFSCLILVAANLRHVDPLNFIEDWF